MVTTRRPTTCSRPRPERWQGNRLYSIKPTGMPRSRRLPRSPAAASRGPLCFDPFGRVASDLSGPRATSRSNSATMPRGARLSNRLDKGRHRFISITWVCSRKSRIRLGNSTTAQFDDNLRLKPIGQPRGRRTEAFSWCACGSPASLTDGLGHTITLRQHDSAFNRLTGYTDALGNTTSHALRCRRQPAFHHLPGQLPASNSAVTQRRALPQNYVNRRNQPVSQTCCSPPARSRAGPWPMAASFAFNYDTRGNLLAVTNQPTPSTGFGHDLRLHLCDGWGPVAAGHPSQRTMDCIHV